MKTLKILAAAVIALFAAHAMAGSVPYQNVGHVAPTNTFTATATGVITGYFVLGGSASGGYAGDLDYVQMLDLTNPSADTGWHFDNQTTVAGATANFGNVQAGDVLEFQLRNAYLTTTGNPNGIILSSNPANSYDGLNHAYSTSFAGGTLNGVNIPAGTYVGMEDLPESFYGYTGISDFNYNDDTFVFTDVGANDPSATPEPGSLVLMGTGLLGVAVLVRKKVHA